MEVHHHTHAHGKKTWREYGWEFLMLFLAVFCGFLAEYQLEHVIERQREKQYIESMIADLKSDQESLAEYSAQFTNAANLMDSMITVLAHPAHLSNHTGELYYWTRFAPRIGTVTTNTRTYEQLKYSGNFRVIHELVTSNKIMAYYEMLPLVNKLQYMYETEFIEYKRLAGKIFDPAVFRAAENAQMLKRTEGNPQLRKNDPDLIQELSMHTLYMRGTLMGVIDQSKNMRSVGRELIEYLRKKYDLE
jgi:hypothetical protein